MRTFWYFPENSPLDACITLIWELNGKYFSIVVKEYWDGEITRIDTLTNATKHEGLNYQRKS